MAFLLEQCVLRAQCLMYGAAGSLIFDLLLTFSYSVTSATQFHFLLKVAFCGYFSTQFACSTLWTQFTITPRTILTWCLLLPFYTRRLSVVSARVDFSHLSGLCAPTPHPTPSWSLITWEVPSPSWTRTLRQFLGSSKKYSYQDHLGSS